MIRQWAGLLRHRALATSAPAPPASAAVDVAPHDIGKALLQGRESLGAKKPALPPINTQKPPVYRLPHYGAAEAEISALPDAAVSRALRVYGGLMRARDDADVLRDRLLRATRADYLRAQLTMDGVVVSNKMDKSVVVAARRRCYEPKLQLKYWRTRRFMAHDELNLCREGDRVIIRSCRPLSKRKAFVVVENFGDPMLIGDDNRADDIAKAVHAAADDDTAEDAAADDAGADGSGSSATSDGSEESGEKKVKE